MKKSFTLILSLLISAHAFSSDLNLDYGSIVQEIKACRKSIMGCTAEQELQIAEIDGKVLNSYDLNSYLSQDTQKSYFIPLALDNKELLTLAAATSLGVIAFHNDQEIMDVVQNHKSNITAPIASVGNFLGSNAIVPLVAGSYFLGVYYQNDKLKQVALFTVGASIAQGIVTTAVKNVAGRARPYAGKGPDSFFNSGKNDTSFYSGHTAEAFTIATVISEMYKEDYPIVPWVAYGVASITAYARVHDQAHWASDVIIGAVAGHLLTKLALSAMNGNKEDRGGLLIYPSIDINTGTLTVNAEWTPKEKERPLKCAKMPDGEAKIHACFEEALSSKK